MNQTSFLPVKIAHEEPHAGTKDLKLTGYTSDLLRYAIKRERDGDLLPVSEWIGHHLCRLCGIPTPEFSIVECVDGTVAFGSRWEETAFQITHLLSRADAFNTLSAHASSVSAIYGIDLFFPNTDRHAGNYLFVPRAGAVICLAMDFSMAGPAGSRPMGVYPLSPGCATLAIIRDVMMNYLNKFDQASFDATISALKSLSSGDFSAILDAAPDEWFVAAGRRELLDWWDNEALSRLTQIRP